MRTRTFELEMQLNPSQVYCAAVGMFEVNGFELVEIVEESSQIPAKVSELARVYRNPRNNRLHVLYFPGKDNDRPITDSDVATPLSRIKREVEEKCTTKLNRAVHSMVVCESNHYYIFKVDHFIYASLEDGVLTTEDSINRDYNESYLDQLTAHDAREKKKRGWQRQVFDKWQCGHFVLQALHRKINEIPDPLHLEIDETIVDAHDDYYRVGTQLVKRGYDKPHQTTLAKRVFDETSYTSIVVAETDAPMQSKVNDTTADDDLDELLSSPTDRHSPYDEVSSLLPTAKKKQSLMQRHPWLKTALIGFGIGLIVTGIIFAAAAITVATMGAGAPAIAAGVVIAGAIVGAKFGLAGAAATGVGLTALAVGTGALCATTGAVVGSVMSSRKTISISNDEIDAEQAITNSQTRIRSVTHANARVYHPEETVQEPTLKLATQQPSSASRAYANDAPSMPIVKQNKMTSGK